MSADIFIIGTNPSTGGQIQTVLQTVGYSVLCTDTVAEALASISPTETQLVFLDTTTISFGLADEISNILAVGPKIEFILIAEYQDPILEQEARSRSVVRWLYRPFTAPEVILAVAAALEMASAVGKDGVAEEHQSQTKHPQRSLLDR